MAGLGRRTFAPGEVLTASNVMNYLQDQTVMNFAGTAARGSAIGTAVSEGMVSYLADSNEIEVYTGSAWEQVYPSVANTGEVIQVLQTTKTDTFTTTSTSYVAVTGMSVTITARSVTSKFLILAQVAHGLANTNSVGAFKITRGGTDIYIGDAASNRTRAVFGGYSDANNRAILQSESIIFLDSPATLSPVTYQLETKVSSGTSYLNRSEYDVSTDANAHRGASSITVLEIVG